MNHGRKFAFAFLLLSILMLPRFAAAQAKQPAILQIQNSGTTAGTAANYFKINFTTGCTTTFSNGVFSIACTGGAGNPGGSANQIQYNNAGTSFGAFTMTGDCSIVVATGVITCTASNGTPFASGAFAAAYSLPAATSSTLGGVKPDGTTLSNTSGAIGVNYTSPTYFPFQSVTTTGSSGPASLSAGVLNIPQYGGGLPTGVLCSPLLNTSGSTTYATDSLMCDVLTFPGSTFDVKENNANAFAMTTGFSNLDARSANTLAGSQTVASQMNVGRLPAPSLTTSGSGSSLTNVAYYLVYCLDSTIYPNCPGTNDVSSESTITPTAGQNIVVASPTYPGAATTYSVAMATTSDSELYCTAATGVSVGSPATLSAACSGAAITKATSNASVILYTPASCVWNVSITDGVSYGLMIGGRGGVVGTGMGEGQPCRLHPASSATNVAAMWGSDPNPISGTSGGSYVSLAGFGAINNVSGATVPYTFIGQLTFDSSSFTNLDNVNQFGVSNWIWGTKDGTQVINLHGEGSSVSTGDVCQIGKAGITTQATEFHGLACVHPGSGHHAINYLQSGNNNLFFDTYMESMAGAGCDTTTPLADLATTGGTAGPVVFDGLTLGAVCSGSVAPVVQIESGLTNYRISHLYGTTDLHAIVDNSYGPGVTCASSPCTVMDYGFSNLGVFNFNGATFARGGATIGTPTGGAEGAGTLNATGLYINGSAVGTGGPGTGTQYTHPYWSTTSALGSVAPTTGYDGVPQVETNSTTSGVFTAAPVSSPQGVPVDLESGSTFTVALTDRYKVLNTTNATTSTAVTVPAPSTTGFGLNFVFAHLNSGSVVATDTPTTATVNGNSTMKLVGAVAGHNPEAAFWWEDSSTSCSSGPCYWGAEILPTDANGQLAAEGLNVANACPTCVVASSPGVGIAHFAGSTQTVTSSTIATGDIAANAVTLAKLATQTANTVLANVTGSTAAPTAAAIPAGVQFYTAGTGYSAATSANILAVCTTCVTSAASLATGGVVLGTAGTQASATNTQLVFSGSTLTVGLATTGTGILALGGGTSGTSTITGPATAGTLTNPIAFSNAISTGTAPTVTTPGTGFYVFGTEGTEPASIAASTDGFNFDSTSHCPVQWNNAANVGCSAALGATESFTAVQTFTGNETIFTPAAKASGVVPYFQINTPTDTGLTASTESPGFQTVTGTRTWATTGTVATQREYLFVAPTYASASASQTFTKAATLAVSAAPIAGSNAIITNPYAFWVQAGQAELDGALAATSTTALGSTGQFAVSAAGLVTKSNGITTAGQGFSPIVGVTSQKSETTTADANVLTVTPASAAGTYRINVVISVSAATSGIIGWTATWTDSNGNAQTPAELELFQNGTAAPALTFTTSAAGNYHGSADIDVNNAGTNIVIKWIGGGTTTAKMSATIERII